MHSAEHCRIQSAECLRLSRLTQNADEARILINLSRSWTTIANQTDRYAELMNERRVSTWRREIYRVNCRAKFNRRRKRMRSRAGLRASYGRDVSPLSND